MEKEQVILVYLIKQETESSQEIPIKFGGKPVWIYNHKIERFQCLVCKNQLTFLCQVFAPLNTDHTYNRAFYIFFCEGDKCQNNKKCFQVYRMQSSQSDGLIPYFDTKPLQYKQLKSQYYVQTDIIDYSQLKAIGDKVIKELNEIDQQDQDSDIQEQKINNIKVDYVNEDEDLEGIEELTQTKKQDPVFQTYRGTISKLNYPVILYASKPLEFKDEHINTSQKKCATCKGPMRFEFQINSSLLSNFDELLSYDWGTIRVYTCESSCKGDKQSIFKQDVQLQIEQDTATNRQEIQRQLAEIQKQNKKKQMKKQKRKQKKQEKRIKKEQEDDKEQIVDKKQGSQIEEVEGDWD